MLSKWADSEATYVILHGLFGGVELLVVRAATWLMNKSGLMDGDSEEDSTRTGEKKNQE